MNILVTGAAGFIGRRVVAALAADGQAVWAVDQFAHDHGSSLVTSVQDDLRDPRELLARLPPGEPFRLVHLAWDMDRQPGAYARQAVQVGLVAGLLDAGLGEGLQSAVMLGSAEEYGQRAGVLHEGDAPLWPLSPYGWAKRAAGELAVGRCGSAGVDLLWLRPFIVYGPGQRGEMAIPYALRTAQQGTEALFTDGLQQRDFIHVDDVVRAITAGVLHPPRGAHVVNLGCEVGVPLRDVLLAIAREFSAESKFKLGARPRRPGEPEQQVADCNAARTLLGWQARKPWREGIAEICRAARETSL